MNLKMKSKPQCSTKLHKLLIMCNKSKHHERRMYVEVWRNLIKCILNGPSLCCSSFSVKMPRGSWRQEEGLWWKDAIEVTGSKKTNIQKLKDFHNFEFCTDGIRSKLWTRWHPVLPLTHICACYMEKRKLETWKRVRLTLLAHNLVFLYSSTPLRCW